MAQASASPADQNLGLGRLGLREDDASVITAPLSHNGPFICLVQTLLLGGRAVLTGRFDSEKVLATVEQERANWLYLVPTMMGRIRKLPTAVRVRFDLASLRTVVHMGAPCPVWLKQAWADWLGLSYRYLGASAKSDPGGWETLGDVGRLNEEGYLYIEDREDDMIMVGGSNVYPAEIEAALLEHPAVLDCCVIGLPHHDLGRAPHALVYAPDGSDAAELTPFAAERLAPYKRPRSMEFVDAPMRDATGKVRRRQLHSERIVTPASPLWPIMFTAAPDQMRMERANRLLSKSAATNRIRFAPRTLRVA